MCYDNVVNKLQTPRLRSFDDILPEVVLIPQGDNAATQRASRLKQQGRLRVLYRGVYSSNIRADDIDVVRRNWSQILAYLAPGVVVSHRSAFDMMPQGGVMYISRAEGRRDYALPGLAVKGVVKAARGPVVQTQRKGAADVPYQGIYVASQPRAFLESLTLDKRLIPRQLSRNELEGRLEKIMRLRGRHALNDLRDDAREVAQCLDMPAEFKTLDGLIGALLGTHPSNNLNSAQALARAQGLPYDAKRLELFGRATAQLRGFPFADIQEPARRGSARDMFAFVEAYFSNYIEGTTFTLEEAQQIVFQGKLIAQRNEDSHDVKGTFEAAQRDPFYSVPPRDEQTLLDWLQRVNAQVMQTRLDKMPGQWKEQSNQAGSTLFVMPELVPETLRRVWPMFGALEHPMQKALLAMFIVSEIHPFADGNGRTARLLMNCFLSQQEQCRIIVPTVFREDYLLSLKALTQQGDATAYIRAMRLCQAWASELAYDVDVAGVNQQLEACNAKKEDTRLYRLLSPRTREAMQVPE